MNQQAKFAPFASAQSYEQTLVPRESLPGRAERVASSVKTGAANLVIDNAISPLERLKSVQTQWLDRLETFFRNSTGSDQGFLAAQQFLPNRSFAPRFVGLIPIGDAEELERLCRLVEDVQSESTDPNASSAIILNIRAYADTMLAQIRSFNEDDRVCRIVWLGAGYYGVLIRNQLRFEDRDILTATVISHCMAADVLARMGSYEKCADGLRGRLYHLFVAPFADRLAMFTYSAFCPLPFESAYETERGQYFVPPRSSLHMPLGAITLARGRDGTIEVALGANRPGLILEAVSAYEAAQRQASTVGNLIAETINILEIGKTSWKGLSYTINVALIQTICTALELDESAADKLRSCRIDQFWQIVKALKPDLFEVAFENPPTVHTSAAARSKRVLH